jgi:hypothetical protein
MRRNHVGWHRGLLRGNPRDSEKIEGTRDKRDIDQQTGTDLKR